MYKKHRPMDLILKANFVLALGLLIRIYILVIHVPTLSNNLYLPFFASQSHPFDFSAVNHFTNASVSPFPYGLPMYLVSLPIFIVTKTLGLSSTSLIATLALAAFSLLPDLLIFRIIWSLKKDFRVLMLWTFSPIVLSSAYYSGQTDLWPAVALLLSAYLILEKRDFSIAGILLGLAIGFKWGLVLVVPFIIVFMLDNPRYKQNIRRLLTVTSLVAVISYLPLIFSSDFRKLVLGGNTGKDVLELAIDFGGFKFYLVPAAYLLLLIWIYRAGRTTAQVLIVFLSVAVISIATLTPGSFGWILWTFPTLLAFLNITDKKLSWLIGIFQAMYFFAKSELFSLSISQTSDWLFSTLNSVLLIFATVLMIRILQHGVKQGDLYGLAKRPFSISIAGDSGVGKDTLANSIANSFGKEASTVICGDNYHLYERGDYVWGSHTHLNPRMNDLKLWCQDLNESLNRNVLRSREYDHSVGRFSSVSMHRKSDLIISQGLHANYREVTRKIDASIFVEMEDDLRLHLKMKRDTTHRNQTKEQIEDQLRLRKPDFEKYIAIQKTSSDLCIKFHSIDRETVRNVEISTLNLPGFRDELLTIFLSYFPEAILRDDPVFDFFTIDASLIDKSSIESALRRKLLSYDQFFPVEPIVDNGVSGIIQLISFMLIDYKRRNMLVHHENS